MTRMTKLAPILLAGALALAACGSSAGSDSSVTTTAASGASTTAGAASGSAQKVSANDASQAEIAAALDAAGVANADRWAGEVVEYRPYDDADQGFPRLREELAKYNPPAGTVDQIVAVLNP